MGLSIPYSLGMQPPQQQADFRPSLIQTGAKVTCCWPAHALPLARMAIYFPWGFQLTWVTDWPVGPSMQVEKEAGDAEGPAMRHLEKSWPGCFQFLIAEH